MEDDEIVRKLMEMINKNDIGNAEEIKESIPTWSLTDDFSDRLEKLLVMKEAIFHPQWQSHLYTYHDIMFTSHTMYLKCVIFPCITESSFHENVFAIFISVSALLRFFTREILFNSGTHFGDLNTDVFMVVFDHVMKRNFYENGGLQQLAEYILGHGYHSWDWGALHSTDTTARDKIRHDIQIERFLSGYGTRRTVGELTKMVATCGTLARKVLSTTSVELSALFKNLD